jgi:nitrogen fixation NifU-like protein
MPFSLDPTMMRQIIMDHYEHPRNKRTPTDSRYEVMHMDSVSCVDNINIYSMIDDDVVVDAAFDGVACAISTASTSIMTELLIGKTRTDPSTHQTIFSHDPRKPYDEEALQDAIVFMNTHKQAARINAPPSAGTGLRKSSRSITRIKTTFQRLQIRVSRRRHLGLQDQKGPVASGGQRYIEAKRRTGLDAPIPAESPEVFRE